MIFISPSVRHTGRNFLQKRIYEPSFRVWPRLRRPVPAGLDAVLTGHYVDSSGTNNLWKGFAPKYTAILPIRHPARVAEAYRVRFAVSGVGFDDFKYQWECMMELSEICKEVLWLHLDDPTLREEQAERIQLKLGIKQPIDWTISEEINCRHGTHNIAITEELLDGIPPEFIKFYESRRTA